MKTNCIIFSVLLTTTSCIIKLNKEVQAKHHSNNCTQGINDWGNYNLCSCYGNNRYDKRIGFCLPSKKPLPKLTATGIIKRGIIAIGGETTGFHIVHNNEIYELILKNQDKKNIAKNPNQELHIVGEELLLPSTETKDRKAIIVENISPP